MPSHEQERHALHGASADSLHASVDSGHAQPHRQAKPPKVRYLGFRTTAEGREYSLRATDEHETRLFAIVITHEVLASRGVRFQDGPDLCYAKLQRDLAAEPGIPAASRLVVTALDLVEYRVARESRPSGRRRSRSTG